MIVGTKIYFRKFFTHYTTNTKLNPNNLHFSLYKPNELFNQQYRFQSTISRGRTGSSSKINSLNKNEILTTKFDVNNDLLTDIVTDTNSVMKSLRENIHDVEDQSYNQFKEELEYLVQNGSHPLDDLLAYFEQNSTAILTDHKFLTTFTEFILHLGDAETALMILRAADNINCFFLDTNSIESLDQSLYLHTLYLNTSFNRITDELEYLKQLSKTQKLKDRNLTKLISFINDFNCFFVDIIQGERLFDNLDLETKVNDDRGDYNLLRQRANGIFSFSLNRCEDILKFFNDFITTFTDTNAGQCYLQLIEKEKNANYSPEYPYGTTSIPDSISKNGSTPNTQLENEFAKFVTITYRMIYNSISSPLSRSLIIPDNNIPTILWAFRCLNDHEAITNLLQIYIKRTKLLLKEPENRGLDYVSFMRTDAYFLENLTQISMAFVEIAVEIKTKNNKSLDSLAIDNFFLDLEVIKDIAKDQVDYYFSIYSEKSMVDILKYYEVLVNKDGKAQLPLEIKVINNFIRLCFSCALLELFSLNKDYLFWDYLIKLNNIFLLPGEKYSRYVNKKHRLVINDDKSKPLSIHVRDGIRNDFEYFLLIMMKFSYPLGNLDKASKNYSKEFGIGNNLAERLKAANVTKDIEKAILSFIKLNKSDESIYILIDSLSKLPIMKKTFIKYVREEKSIKFENEKDLCEDNEDNLYNKSLKNYEN